MNYIEELCLCQAAARRRGGLRQFQAWRRYLLKAYDPAWQRYWNQIRLRHSQGLVEACQYENFYAFRDLVLSMTPNAAVFQLVNPTSVLDWKWMRREVMLERYTTIQDIAHRCGRPVGAVRGAIYSLGGRPEYACHGLGRKMDHFWSCSWLTDPRIVSCLSSIKNRPRKSA